jgi:N-methylhydantoinase A
VEVIEKNIAKPLSLSVEEASLSIHAMANAKIAEGIRAATVRRGSDPRDFALFSFGGAGGVHADLVGRELLIPKVIIPREASVLSALGFLSSDVRHDYSAPIGKSVPAMGAGEIKATFDALEKEARELLATEGFTGERVRFARMLDCRYQRQIFSVQVDVEPADLTKPNYDWLVGKFEASYEALYSHIHKNVAGYVDTCRLAAFGVQPPLVMKQREGTGADPSKARRGARRVYLGAWTDASVYWFDDLLPGMTMKGPALVDSASTSVLIVPGSTATIDKLGSIHITRANDGH